MIQVLLVDDEPFIRKGMRVLVDWESYGYEIAGEARDGEEALRLMGQMPVDLVFVDMRMPGISGIELIGRVQEEISEKIRFVILTGHADFSYARQAISLKVWEYMLKPVQKEELLRILREIKKEFEEEDKKLVRERERERLEYETCVAHVLWGKYTEEELLQISGRLSGEGTWQYISFEFDSLEADFAGLDLEERAQLQNRCQKYLRELLGEDSFHAVPLMEQGEHIFGAGLLFTPRLAKERGMDPMEWIGWLQNRISRHFSRGLQVYLGEPEACLERLAKSYHSLRAARCLHSFSVEKGAITGYRQRQKGRRVLELTEIEELVEQVKENRQEGIVAAAGQVFGAIRESAMSMEVLSANIYHLLYRLLELARELDEEDNQEEILQYISRESFEELALSRDQSELTRFVLEYADYLDQLRRAETGDTAEKVKAYVREHYREKLSLKELGERFFVNNVYLGQLFKKRYGIGFKEYLNEVRMEEAIRLLGETDLHIYAVAREVGFSDGDYFINKFVQTRGMTPFQFRKKMKRGEVP